MKLADAYYERKEEKNPVSNRNRFNCIRFSFSNHYFLDQFADNSASSSSNTVYNSSFSNVELNASEGFTSSQLVEGPNISPLFILPPGGTGTIPFTVYSSAQVPFNVSLSIYLGEKRDDQRCAIQFFSRKLYLQSWTASRHQFSR